MTVGLIDMLAGGQGGRLYANAGAAAGLSPDEAAKAMAAISPAIAQRLKAAAEADPQLFDSLLELINDGAAVDTLSDPQAFASAETVSDGNAILEEIYGSRDAAIKDMRKLADLPEGSLLKLAPLCASTVVAALTRANAPAALTNVNTLSSGGGGIMGTIVEALVKGVMQGVSRQLQPKRRRSYSSYFGRKKTRTPSKTTRKSTGTARKTARSRTAARTPSIEDIFRSILKL